MADKTLPEVYREAAYLVLKVGKVTGQMKSVRIGVSGDKKCLGFCTMGAVFEAKGGILDELGYPKIEDFTETTEFLRLAKPVADQIVSSGRYARMNDDEDHEPDPFGSVFWTVANWNDRKKPTADEIAKLLRETADAVEKEDAN